MPRVKSQYVTLLGVYWTCDKVFLRKEKNRLLTLKKDARAAALLVYHPEMIRAAETDLGFFCLFKSRDTARDTGEAFRERFQTLAKRAGIAIGACKDHVYVWLHHVFNSLIENKGARELSSASAGQEAPGVAYPWERFLLWQEGTKSGFLLRVCEASAIVCSRLESQALDAERSKQNIGGQAHGALNIRLERGKRCGQIVEEMKRFRYLRISGGKTVSQIRSEQPDFVIWSLRESLDPEDRDLFDNPNRWETRPAQYAYGLLAKDYSRSWTTIKDWVKAWNKSQKSLA
jgi:hypothetical protein